MQLTFENKSFKPIRSITFKLTIKEKSSKIILYRKQHTVSVDLAYDEVCNTEVFKLSNNVTLQNKMTSDNIDFSVEIISVK